MSKSHLPPHISAAISADIARMIVENRKLTYGILMPIIRERYGVEMTRSALSCRIYRIRIRNSVGDLPVMPAPWIRTCDEIVARMARKYGTDILSIMQMARFAHIAAARHEAINLIRAALPAASLSQIGAYFRTCHSTISFALRGGRARFERATKGARAA